VSGAAARVLVVVAVLGACTRTPYTGRVQSTVHSPDEASALADRGVVSYRRGIRADPDPVARARVDRVLHALVEAAKAGPAGDHAGRLAWNAVVVDSPNTGVASFANGALFVDGGLVRAMPTDDALATRLGHAVARVLLRHGDETAGYRAARIPVMAGTTLSAPRSRSELGAAQDEEADWVGLVLAVEAGYDPDRAMAAFDRLGLRERGERVRKRLPELRARSAGGSNE
jgi:predicted Zn-dependent protease